MVAKVLHVVMVILMSSLTSALPLKDEDSNDGVNPKCMDQCPAGKYLSSCQCIACSHDSFTSQTNSEHSCHPCFKNCRRDLNMEEVQPCSTVSDVVCRCMEGYNCTSFNPLTHQCRSCEKKTTSTPAQTSTTVAPYNPKANPSQKTHDMSDIWIVIMVLLGIFVCFCIALQACRQRRQECLKKLVKRCSPSNQKEDIASTSLPSQLNQPIKAVHTEEVHPHTPTSISSTSDCPTPQPVSTEQPLPSTGNLGPLHIYGAGTVFVSLLNQFGLNGGEKDEDDVHQESFNESEHHSPTSSLPLSTEERNRDSGYISYPSQEQGKECHMSKEEGL